MAFITAEAAFLSSSCPSTHHLQPICNLDKPTYVDVGYFELKGLCDLVQMFTRLAGTGPSIRWSPQAEGWRGDSHLHPPIHICSCCSSFHSLNWKRGSVEKFWKFYHSLLLCSISLFLFQSTEWEEQRLAHCQVKGWQKHQEIWGEPWGQ